MVTKKDSEFDSNDMQRMESSLEELVQLCGSLQRENNNLRNEQIHLQSERAQLIKKNTSSREKMEAIIMRLKSMELEI